MTTPDRPDDPEVSAYVDGELAPAQRAALEVRAAADPRLARRLMEDAALTELLRGAQAEKPRVSAENRALARRLGWVLRARAALPALRRTAAAAAFTALGFGLHALLPGERSSTTVADGAFVETAREALRVAALDSGPETAAEPINRKIDRLETVTDVLMPQIPANWTVRSVQVQPFQGKPSVVVTADSPLGPVTLVAAPMEEETAVPPTPAPDETVPTVTWQIGGTAYALMGSAAPRQLKSVADGIEVASRRKAFTRIRS